MDQEFASFAKTPKIKVEVEGRARLQSFLSQPPQPNFPLQTPGAVAHSQLLSDRSDKAKMVQWKKLFGLDGRYVD
jgi:hypothetical protein